MIYLYTLIAVIIWLAYSELEGFREGWHWHYKVMAKNEDKTDAHGFFMAQRCLVGLLIVTVHSLLIHSINPCLILFMFMSFPFMHDGAYYYHRHILDNKIYPKKFFDQSTTSTAFSTKYFPPVVRTILFIASLFLVFFTISFN